MQPALRLTDYSDFARYLGDHDEPLARKVVEVAWTTQLPANWTEETNDGRLYFFNHVTEEAVWVHPLDSTYRDVIAEVKRWNDTKCDFATACTLAALHIEQVTETAIEDLSNWRGPFWSEDGDEKQAYYYNIVTKGSSWESPLIFWDHSLRFRAAALEQCISLFVGEPKPFTDSVCSLLERFSALRAPKLELQLVKESSPKLRIPSTNEPVDFMSSRSRDTGIVESDRGTGRSEYYTARSLADRSSCRTENPHVFTVEA